MQLVDAQNAGTSLYLDLLLRVQLHALFVPVRCIERTSD